jgi:hypothetical protein
MQFQGLIDVITDKGSSRDGHAAPDSGGSRADELPVPVLFVLWRYRDK